MSFKGFEHVSIIPQVPYLVRQKCYNFFQTTRKRGHCNRIKLELTGFFSNTYFNGSIERGGDETERAVRCKGQIPNGLRVIHQLEQLAALIVVP